MKTVITPVGVSLFTNYMRVEVKEAMENAGRTYKCIDDDFEQLRFIPASEFNEHRWKNRIENLERVIKKYWFVGIQKVDSKQWEKNEKDEPNTNASAEIKSILSIEARLPEEELTVYLIATDTILSRLAAELIKEWFSIYYKKTKVIFEARGQIAKELQIQEGKAFEKEGVPNLLDICFRIVGGNYENTILNITGGYKALIPYLTIFAQVNSIPLFYIFENTDELIQIPQAPIDINWGTFEKYADIFRELENTVEDSWDDYRRRNNLQEDFQACVMELQDESGNHLLGLNPIGRIFWHRYQNFFVVYFPRGSKYFGEDANKKRQLNHAIQELFRKLRSIDEPLETLTDNLLKHTVIGDMYVYKHTSPQIRILYRFQNHQLEVYNYYFIDSEQVDRNYSSYMRRDLESLKNHDLIPVAFKKEA